jgi:uncharacterized protein
VQALISRTSIDHHWSTLNKEFGGLNEVLWRLHQQAAANQQAAGQQQAAGTAEPGLASPRQLRAVASHFDRPCLLGPLAAEQDMLAHMHANTQLPVLSGALSRFESTGDEVYRSLAGWFVTLLLKTRTFATGGSSIGEYWVGANQLGELVAAGEATTQVWLPLPNMAGVAPTP